MKIESALKSFLISIFCFAALEQDKQANIRGALVFKILKLHFLHEAAESRREVCFSFHCKIQPAQQLDDVKAMLHFRPSIQKKNTICRKTTGVEDWN